MKKPLACRPPQAPRVLLLCVLFSTQPSCQDAAERPRVLLRDSAGVQIVENLVPEWSEGQAWVVDSEPFMEIGAVQGEDPVLFHEITGVAFLEDGGLLILDSGSGEARLFDAGGQFLFRAGGHGQGPGEFAAIGKGGPYGPDSIWVEDYRLDRISVFDRKAPSTPRLIDASRLRAENYRVESALKDGRWVLRSAGSRNMAGPPGIQDDSTWVVGLSRDGRQLDSLARARIGVREVREQGRSPWIQLSPYYAMAGGPDGLYLAEGDVPEIRVYSPGGQLARVARASEERQPVTQAIRSEYVDGYVEWLRPSAGGNPTVLEQIREQVTSAEYADFLPATSRILVDPSGFVWLSHHHYPWDLPTRWRIFDPGGRWLGSLSTPDGLDVMTVRAGAVAGVVKDSLGVERVRVHSVTH